MKLHLYQYIKNNIRLENLYLYFLVLLTFSLSFFLRTIPYLVAATGVSWLFSKNLKKKLYVLFHNRFFILISIFYMLHIIGLIYSENLHEGKLVLEAKLSLLVLPIVFFSSQTEIKSFYKLIINAFIAGIISSLIICYLIALYKARLNANPGEILNFAVWHYYDNWPLFKLIFSGISLLNYSWLSFFMHPNYISMYICFAIYLIYYKLISLKTPGIKQYFRYILILVFLILSLLLLQSRTGIIVLVTIIIFESIYKLVLPGKRILKLSIALFILISILVSIVNSERFKLIVGGKSKISYERLRENNVRIQLWEKIVPVLDKNWLTGLGTGDVKDSFEKVYTKELFNASGQKYLNFHNEYIETTVRLGLPGLIILLIIIFYPMIYRRPISRNRVLAVFTIIIVVNFFFESILVRLNGIIFFALFYCMLNLFDFEENDFFLI